MDELAGKNGSFTHLQVELVLLGVRGAIDQIEGTDTTVAARVRSCIDREIQHIIGVDSILAACAEIFTNVWLCYRRVEFSAIWIKSLDRCGVEGVISLSVDAHRQLVLNKRSAEGA